MSTKKETTTTNQYNTAGMNTYNSFMPVVQKQMLDYANNPGQLQNA